MLMKLSLNKNDLSKLQTLIDTKYLNMEADDLFSSYLQEDYLSVTRQDVMDLVNTQSMSKKEAFLTSLLLNRDISPEDEEIQKMKEEGYFEKVDRLNAMPYKKNPYGASLDIQEKEEAEWSLSYNYYAPYEGFLYDDVYSDPNHYFMERNSIGFFEEKVPYLCLIEKSVLWMSITPFEINTMKTAIDNAHGKVITYGLGLGYFSFMAINNPNVESVTVIEKDPKAIKMFESEILPKIRLRDKLTIIKGDAVCYTKKRFSEDHYDYAFFDIYHSAADGIESYLRMKKIEDRNPECEFVYWIENSLLALLRRFIITLFEENLQGFTDKDYQVQESPEDRLINAIYQAIGDREFKSYDEIHSFLLDSSLKEFAKKISI